MSVLNQMLRDLEARGESTPAAAARDAAPAPRPPFATVAATANRHAGRSGRALLWGFTVLAIATALALWQWREQQVRAAATARAPLGYSQFKGALGDTAAPAAAATIVATAPQAAMPTDAGAAAMAAPKPVDTSPPAAAVSTVPAAPVVAPAVDTAKRAASPRANPPATTSAQPTEDSVVRRSVASAADAEADVARAAELIARGRATDAATALKQILAARPQHVAARRALAALQAEAGLRDAALVTLLEGAAVEPARFAPLAASLQVELGDAAGALATLERVPAGARTPQHHALTAGIAQRVGRHDAAVDAYRHALGANATEPVWWIGLGVSLEALGLRADAHAAYERATAIPTMGTELRAFATQKLSHLATTRKPASEALVSAQP